MASITVKLKMGPDDVWEYNTYHTKFRCPVCWGLVASCDKQAHTTWHEDLAKVINLLVTGKV